MAFGSGLLFNIFKYDTYNGFTPFGPEGRIDEETSFLGFGIAGLFVGFGSKLANGCTSGHGLCGLSRLSLRSIVFVSVFLTVSFAVGSISYYIGLGSLSSEELTHEFAYNHVLSANIFLGFGLVFPIVTTMIEKKYNQPDSPWKQVCRDIFISWIVGLLFGIGIVVAGMSRRINVLSFYWLGKHWNPSLLLVLGSGLSVSVIAFNYMLRVRKVPILGD